MDDDPLAEALRVLRAADALRRSLPAGSRDREMIEAHILVLDREIHTLVTAEPNGDDANQLRAASRATRFRIQHIEAGMGGR